MNYTFLRWLNICITTDYCLFGFLVLIFSKKSAIKRKVLLFLLKSNLDFLFLLRMSH